MTALWIEASLRTLVLLVCGELCLRLLADRGLRLELRIRRLLLLVATAMPLLVWAWSRDGMPAAVSAAMPARDGQLGSVIAEGLLVASPWWLSLVYLAGVALLLVRLLVGVVFVSRLWADASPVGVGSGTLVGRVRESRRVSSPICVGGGVILPMHWRAWGAEELRMVLAHERSHLDRRDYQWALLARVQRALFWFNPLSWTSVRRLLLVGERLSDRAAVEASGQRERYIALLLACAAAEVRPSLSAAMARRSELAERIAQLGALRRPARVSWVRKAVVASAALLLAMVSATASALQVPALGAPRDGGALGPAPSRPLAVQGTLRPLSTLAPLSGLGAAR